MKMDLGKLSQKTSGELLRGQPGAIRHNKDRALHKASDFTI